jgi:hypothetical protein
MVRGRRLLRRGGAALALDAALALAVLSIAVAAPWKDAPRLAGADASGAVALTNSRAGQAIFSGRELRPGESTAGTVSVGNPGPGAVTVMLAATVAADAPGPAGGRLGDRVQLRVRDVTGSDAVTVYDGRLAALSSLALGTFAPRETRRYEFVATLPELGEGDNAYQGATLSTGFTWSATAIATPTPAPTAAPVPTAAPAPAAPAPPAPVAQAPVSAASVIVLPSAKRRLTARRITVRFRAPSGRRIRSATVQLGRAKARRYGSVARTTIDLRRVKGRKVTVIASAMLDDGTRFSLRRTYRR